MLVRALKLQLAEEGALVGALEACVAQKWAANVVNGQTILATAEAGGSVTLRSPSTAPTRLPNSP